MVRASAVVLCCVVVLVAGCSAPKPAGGSGQQPGASAPAPPLKADVDIQKAVEKAYSGDAGLTKEKDLKITVQDGRVLLTGSVTTGEMRIRAQDLARSVPDVYGVDAEKLAIK